MKIITEGSKKINKSLGKIIRIVSKAEEEKKKVFRRSIVLNKNMKAGDIIKEKDISLKRPGTGFSPNDIKFIVGKKLKKDFKDDYILTEDDIV